MKKLQELMEEDRQAKELLDNNPKIRETLRNNIPYAAFKDVPGLIMQPDEDICAEIPLKKMFEFIHMKTDVGHCLYYETMRDYVEDRCLIMKEFNFRTLPEILLNLHNLNFNVRLHNEYKFPTEEAKHMNEFTTEELRGMVQWSTHLMQVYVNEGLLGSGGDGSGGPPKTSTTDNVSTGKRTNEQCCVMTNRKKWNFHKKPLVGFCHSPTQGVRHSINLHDPKYLWIGDSGTSCHLTNTDQGMVSWTPIHEEINLGDGTPIYATKQGTMRFEVHQRNGTTSYVTLHDCKYIEHLPQSLFSITKALGKGWKLSNRGVHIVLTNGTSRIEFDRVNPTTTGCIMTVQMVPLVPTVEKSNSMTTRTKSNCTYCTKPTHLTKSDSPEVLAPNPTPYIHSTKMLKDMGNKLKSNQKLSTPKQKVQKTENRRSVATSTKYSSTYSYLGISGTKQEQKLYKITTKFLYTGHQLLPSSTGTCK